LEKQDEIRLIEDELHDMDVADQEDTPRQDETKQGKLFTRHRRNKKEAADRKDFFERAERVYKEYAELLTTANQLATLEKPASHEWKSVNRFISTTKPVVKREAAWIGWRQDVVTLRGPRKHAFFDAIVETTINHAKQWSWLQPKEPSVDKDSDKDVKALNKVKALGKMQRWLEANASAGKAASVTNTVVLSILVPLLFVVPIYALTMVQDHIGESILVLVAFTIAFTTVLAVGTPAEAHEVYGCAAA
jgi:hypothetical protein